MRDKIARSDLQANRSQHSLSVQIKRRAGVTASISCVSMTATMALVSLALPMEQSETPRGSINWIERYFIS